MDLLSVGILIVSASSITLVGLYLWHSLGDRRGMRAEIENAERLAAELAKHEAELRETIEQLTLSADAANVGVWSKKVGEKEVRANNKWNEIFGFEPDQVISVDESRKRIHPDDRERVLGFINTTETEGTEFDYICRLLLPSGEIRWVSSRGQVEFRDGKPYIVRGATADITNRHLAEKSVNDLAAIVESSEDAIFSKTLDGIIATWNSGAEKMYGYTAAEIVGQNVAVLVPDDLEGETDEMLERVKQGNATDHFETERVTKDGRRIYVSLNISPLKDANGKVISASIIARDITRRKLADEAARKSAERNHDLVRALPDLIFLQSPDGVYLDYHASNPRDLAVPPAQFIGKNMRDVLPPDLTEAFFGCFERARETGNPQVHEYMLPIEGNERWFETSIVCRKDGQILSLVREITNRKLAESHLKEREAQLTGLIGSAMDAIISIDEDLNIVLFNRAAELILHCFAEDAIGKPLDSFVPDRLRAAYMDAIREYGETNKTKRLPLPLYGRRATGEEFPLEASFSRFVIDGRNFYTVIIRDITRRHRAERQVRENEHLLSESQRIAHVGSWMWDMAGPIKWTEESYRLVGTTAEEFTPTFESLMELIHPEDRLAVQRWIEESNTGGAPGEMEFRVITPNGSIRILSGRGELIRDADGKPSFMSGTLQDVTARKRTEQALRESEQRFRNMADTAPVMIWVSGPDKQRTYFNEGWLSFTGRKIEQELGIGWADSVHPEDRDRCLSTKNLAFDRREIFTMDYRMRRFDGEYRWVFDTGNPRFSPVGEFLGYIGSCIDITDQKEAETALRDLSGRIINAQELERRRVARELHDDLSQSLALLSIRLQSLVSAVNEPDAVKEKVSEFTLQIQKLTADVHRISHELHPAKLEQLGLESAIRGICREVETLHDIEIDFTAADVPNDLPNDVSLCLYRVAQESLQNVIKHSGANEVSVELVELENEIRLTVNDDGNGFDQNAKRSKESLGLISMGERVRSLNGLLRIESALKKGTKIIACVPKPGQ